MKDVVRGVYIPLHSDSMDLTIRTDSVAGSGERSDVYLYGDDNEIAGIVRIYFSSPIQYNIGRCSGTWTYFPVTLPTQTDKTWRIVYNPAELRVVYYCNEVEVENVVLSDSVCKSKSDEWRTYWEQINFTQVKFLSHDTASDKYCLGEVEPVVVGMYKR